MDQGEVRGTVQSPASELLEARRLYRTWLRAVCGQGRQEEGAA